MTMTAELPRLLDAELNEIARRVASPMNDDGLKAWYAQDVGKLLAEVLALRREVANAYATLIGNPPLVNLGSVGSLPAAVDRIVELWADQEAGIWQRAEVKRIKAKLDAMAQDLSETMLAKAQLAEHAQHQANELDAVHALLEDAQRDYQSGLAQQAEAHRLRMDSLRVMLHEMESVVG